MNCGRCGHPASGHSADRGCEVNELCGGHETCYCLDLKKARKAGSIQAIRDALDRVHRCGNTRGAPHPDKGILSAAIDELERLRK